MSYKMSVSSFRIYGEAIYVNVNLSGCCPSGSSVNLSGVVLDFSGANFTLDNAVVNVSGGINLSGVVLDFSGATFNVENATICVSGGVSISGANINISGSVLGSVPYQNLQAVNQVVGKVMYTDCADKDAFYRLRVSNPQTLYEGSTIYDSGLWFFDDDYTSNATITGPVGAAMTLSITSASTTNQYAARQSHFYAKYQPGKSFMALISFCFGGATSDVTKRVGFYDVDNTSSNLPSNGVLLEQTISGLAFKVYQGSPGNTIQTADQSSWNVDPLNGLGPSGINIDVTKNLLAFIDLEWLGVGRVRCGFFINGVPIVCHTFNNTAFAIPYINNPYLPIRFEIRKTANTSATDSMKAICCTIISEGGYIPIGISTTIQAPILQLSNTEIKSSVSLRLKSSSPRCRIRPDSLEIATDLGGNFAAYYSMYLWRPSTSAVPSGAVWTPVSVLSNAEYSVTDLYPQMIADVSGKYLQILGGTVTSTSKTATSVVQQSLLEAQSNVIKANRDILIIVIDNNSTGNNKKYVSILGFHE